jgi:hypothetical protein
MEFTWEGAAALWDRMGAANRRAEQAWLESLTVDEAIALFEDVCRGVPELDRADIPDDPPVVLFLLWRD